jgi:hypothetical protein
MVIRRQFYIPRSRVELIKGIKPHWKGLKGELYEMASKRLRAIYITIMNQRIQELMRKRAFELGMIREIDKEK